MLNRQEEATANDKYNINAVFECLIWQCGHCYGADIENQYQFLINLHFIGKVDCKISMVNEFLRDEWHLSDFDSKLF